MLESSVLSSLAAKCGISLIGPVDMSVIDQIKPRFQGLGKTPFMKALPLESLDYFGQMEDAKAVLSFAVPYAIEARPPADAQNRGRMAQMAIGKDYHTVLYEMASKLVFEISLFLNREAKAKIFVDNSPLSDKMAAYAAGLGFIGRNSLIINNEYGSYIFLGTILIDEIALPYKPVVENGCFGCSQCVLSCPTGALNDGFEIEGCISYKTQAGKIDEKSAAAGYLYGCDECQECCPYNSHIDKTPKPAFDADPNSAFPLLGEIVSMNKQDYIEKYKGTASYWKGLSAFRRNAKAILSYREKKER